MTTAEAALTVIEVWRRPGLAVLALRGDLSLRSAAPSVIVAGPMDRPPQKVVR